MSFPCPATSAGRTTSVTTASLDLVLPFSYFVPVRPPRAGCPGPRPGGCWRAPGRRPHSPCAAYAALHHLHSAEVLPVFRGSLYIPVCAHGLLTWHRVSLKGAWLCPLCTVLPEAYRHKSVQIDTFINHLSWGRRRESEEEDSVSVAILKVHAPLLLSACSKIRLSTELWRPHLACGGTVHPTACEAPKGDQIKVTSDGSLLQDYTSDQCSSVTLLHTHFKDISKLTQLAPSAWRSLAKQTSSYCLKWVPDS